MMLSWRGEQPRLQPSGTEEQMATRSEYRNTWIAEKLDRINLTVPKGRKESIKAHAEAQGESVNAFINRAIMETMARDNAARGPRKGKEKAPDESEA